MSFQRIVVALDRSPLAAQVFKQALKLARRDKSCLLLVHCLKLKTWENVGSLKETGIDLVRETKLQLQQEHLQEVEQIQKWLESYCEQATNQGVEAQFTCEVGDAGSWICELAQSWVADLVAIGHSGDRGFTQLFLGSVSNHVIRHAPCKVMVVQPGDYQDVELQYACSY